MGYSWGWPYDPRKEMERTEMSTETPQNVTTAPGSGRNRMTRKQKKWMWIGIGVCILALSGRCGSSAQTVSSTQAAAQPAPPTIMAPAPAQPPALAAPVPSEVAPVDQPPVKITTYGSGDYEVGNGSDMIAPGKYKTTGPDGIFKFSTWTTYKDVDRQHMIAFGSVGDGPGIMTVPENAKLVSFSGSAEWVKAK